MVAKLRALKGKQKEWSKTIHGYLKQQKQLVLSQLDALERTQVQRTLEEGGIGSRVVLTAEFEKIAKHEETAWRQISRTVWLKEGDKNTSFFHKTTNAHRGSNTTDKLKGQGCVSD